MDELIDVYGLSIYLGVTVRTIQRWVRDGILPEPIRITRNNIRWKQSVIDHWISKNDKATGENNW